MIALAVKGHSINCQITEADDVCDLREIKKFGQHRRGQSCIGILCLLSSENQVVISAFHHLGHDLGISKGIGLTFLIKHMDRLMCSHGQPFPKCLRNTFRSDSEKGHLSSQFLGHLECSFDGRFIPTADHETDSVFNHFAFVHPDI